MAYECSNSILRTMKCVVSMIVLFLLTSCNMSHIPLLASGSIPDVGSSNMTTSESPISAMPKLILRFIPPVQKSTYMSTKFQDINKKKQIFYLTN